MSHNPLIDYPDLPPFSEIRPEHVKPAVESLVAAGRERIREVLAKGDFSYRALEQTLAEEDDRAQAIGSLIWASTFGTVLGPTIGLGPAPAVAEWMGLPPLAGPYVLCVVLFGAAGLLVWRRLLPDPLAVVGGVGLPAAERPRFWDSAHLLRRSAAGRLGVLGMVSGHVAIGELGLELVDETLQSRRVRGVTHEGADADR